METAVRRAPDRTGGGHHGAMRCRWRDIRFACAHHGGECGLPIRRGVAIHMGEPTLAERARAAYLVLLDLPSNQITREMTRQLGLARHPSGAAAQQGLHHLWANWCYAKDCERCPCNPHWTSPKTL